MKKIFRKTTMGFLSVLLMSMMLVVATAAYPNPFVNNNEANVVIVYGASAAATDITASESLVNNLANSIVTVDDIIDRILSDGVTENEVELGEDLPSGKIRSILTDNKIISLLDEKIYWYDGDNTNSYNIHEEIRIVEGGEIGLRTSLDNNDFEEVALINDRGLEYRYVFDEDIDVSILNTNNEAEPLEVIILGKEYLIEEIGTDSITVTNAEKGLVYEGTSIVVDGVTLTVDSVYENGAFINGVYVEKDKRKTIDNIRVKVKNVYYRDSDIHQNKVELYYGGEISEEYSDGDAYPGENSDDPEWVWSISSTDEEIDYIGVRYDLRQVDEDDNIVYAGEGYTFPNSFATVNFDGLTNVDYSDYEVFFDDNIDLYEVSSTDDKGYSDKRENVDVVIIKGQNDDSFILSDGIETNMLYLYKLNDSIVEVYYKDVADDFNSKPIYTEDDVVLYTETCDDNDPEVCTRTDYSEVIATLIVDDTLLDIKVFMDDRDKTIVSIEDIEVILGENDNVFTHLGEYLEDAESDDVIVNEISIGTYDNDVMNYYGTIIESPEDNADKDRVVIKVPSEQVYAQISVFGSEEDSNVTGVVNLTPAELGITKVTDGQVPSDKNIIVVGGSCINTLAAELLGGKFCGAEFTAKTGVGAGQALIQTFDRGDGNIATLVAGYTAADTTRAIAEFLKGNINIAVGEKVII